MDLFKNIKWVLLPLIALISASVCQAETLSQKQASKIAQAFFNEAYGEVVGSPKMIWNGRQLTTDRLFAPFYIYNHSKGGFVIVAADTKAYPILGYSLTNTFDRSKLKDDDNELLKKYAREVELIRYDSRTPDKAVASWQNIPLYIHKVLNNPYDSEEFHSLSDSRKEILESIDRNLKGVLLPAAVEFDIYNPERFREYSLDDVLAVSDNEVPFSFYEDFISQIAEEERMRLAALEEIISPTKPVVTPLGGAHFEIRFPVEMTTAIVYSLQGTRLIQKEYRNTDTIYMDLSTLPGGFYPVLTLGKDGHVYSFKLYR